MPSTSCKQLEKFQIQQALTNDSGELTFSNRFGFLESGKDLGDMMYHTGKAMDYIGIVRTDSIPL